METAYIGMGANLPSAAGPPDVTLAEALAWLSRCGRVVRRSSLYSTAPVGLAEQPRFLNAVAAVETELGPRELLDELLQIEQRFGRDRSSGVQNGPRTLDLDLLLYGDWVVEAARLEIPHPRLTERFFVLVPLAEIASNVMDVARQRSVAELLQDLTNRFPSENDAIVLVESDAWCAFAVANGDARADKRNADH
ncbi:MAG: 2-amino-4-hydroxy-6-hydroxymethyldihydropteridine diphosphokinase [Acidobacteriota bacterium]